MTRGGEVFEGGLQKFLDTRKGGSKKWGGAPKICILQNQEEWGGGLLKNWAASEGGATKISSFEFQYLHPPFVILNELSLTIFRYLFSFQKNSSF